MAKQREEGPGTKGFDTGAQIGILEDEIMSLRKKVSALRESRQILMGMLQQQMTAERSRVSLLEQDVARLKKENLYYKKQALRQKITS